MKCRMRQWVIVIMLMLLPWQKVQAEELQQVMDGLDLSAWQSALDEAEIHWDVREMLRSLVSGDAESTLNALINAVRQMIANEVRSIHILAGKLLAPALLWAAARLILGEGRTSNAAGMVCYLMGACIMLDSFGEELKRAQAAAGCVGTLTGQVFPVLTALMSASGRVGTAGWMGTLVTFCGGTMTALVQRVMAVLGSGAAILAAAGNLSESVSFKSLFRLCCSAGNWLLSGIMALFIAMTTLGGLMGSAQDGMTIRAAKYAAGSLLPVVGGDVANTMDTMVYSAALVRQAAGITGVVVMLGVCLRPIIGLIMTLLTYRLTAALIEPVSDGALRQCMEQMAQCIRLLLVASLVSAVLFISLTGICLTTLNSV